MMRRFIYLPICLSVGLHGGASAQTIDRVKLTDNDLSCQQIYAESQQMDTAIHLAASSTPVPVAAAPITPHAFAGVTNLVGNNLTLNQMHAPTAALATQQGLPAHMQQQIANNMAAAQSGQYRPTTSNPAQAVAQVGGVASMLGVFAASMAPRPTAVAAHSAPAPQHAGSALAAQAKARKDHLTSLFLSRHCKTSELQK